MPTPWVPPYFGSYAELIGSLLHDPYLGSGRGGVPATHFAALRPTGPGREPDPLPWAPAISMLVEAATVSDLAASLPEGGVRSALEASSSQAIEQFLDDFCGTPPRLAPWPWPGPPPWVFVISSQLLAVANDVQAGGLRERLVQIAAAVVQKGFGARVAGSH